MVWVRARLCKLKKKGVLVSQPQVIVYQLLAHGRWFSLGTLASSTTGRHNIAESATKHQKSLYLSLRSNVLIQ